jgi:hypothetical protein
MVKDTLGDNLLLPSRGKRKFYGELIREEAQDCAPSSGIIRAANRIVRFHPGTAYSK